MRVWWFITILAFCRRIVLTYASDLFKCITGPGSLRCYPNYSCLDCEQWGRRYACRPYARSKWFVLTTSMVVIVCNKWFLLQLTNPCLLAIPMSVPWDGTIWITTSKSFTDKFLLSFKCECVYRCNPPDCLNCLSYPGYVWCYPGKSLLPTVLILVCFVRCNVRAECDPVHQTLQGERRDIAPTLEGANQRTLHCAQNTDQHLCTSILSFAITLNMSAFAVVIKILGTVVSTVYGPTSYLVPR